jgi:hypothetical protein
MDIREIARRAKVSTATVSRAINRVPTVDPQLAKRVYFTLDINAAAQPVGSALHDKHYLRKHGKSAYYGQGKDQR